MHNKPSSNDPDESGQPNEHTAFHGNAQEHLLKAVVKMLEQVARAGDSSVWFRNTGFLLNTFGIFGLLIVALVMKATGYHLSLIWPALVFLVGLTCSIVAFAFYTSKLDRGRASQIGGLLVGALLFFGAGVVWTIVEIGDASGGTRWVRPYVSW